MTSLQTSTSPTEVKQTTTTTRDTPSQPQSAFGSMTDDRGPPAPISESGSQPTSMASMVNAGPQTKETTTTTVKQS